MRRGNTIPHRVIGEAFIFGQEFRSRSEGKTQARAFIEVSLGRARQGRANSLGLASMNVSGGLWAK